MNKLLQPIVFFQHIYPLMNAIIEVIILFQKILYLSILKTMTNLKKKKKKKSIIIKKELE